MGRERKSTNSEVSEAKLIRRSQQGDTDAFGELYERNLDELYRYILYRIGGDVHDAEDLTEEVFLKAWEALDRYQIRDVPLLAWLYRIAHNTIIDHQRKHKSRIVDIKNQHTLSTGETNLEEEVSLGLQMREIAAAIAQLPPNQQEVLALRFISGLKHKETAEVMGQSPQAVRVIQHRALRTLRLWLAKEENAPK